MSGSAHTPETPAQGALFAQRGQDSVITAICEQCGVPLSGKQKRFDSDACRVEWWNLRHPRLNRPVPPPAERGIPIRDRILGLMADRAWRTELEIAEALGILQGTAGAKRRDLEKADFGAFVFEKRTASRAYSRRAWEYRLVVKL